MRSPVVLFAALVVAGCVAPGAVDPADTDLPGVSAAASTIVHQAGAIVPRPEGLADLVPDLLPLGADAFEPTLGVAPDGAIYYAAVADGVLVGWEPLVLKSVDGGATWDDVSPRTPTGAAIPPETNDPYVHVDPITGRVFQFAMAPILTCSMLSWSDDGGASWTTNPHGCFTTPPWDHQTMVASTPAALPTVGYANVLHQCVNSVYAAVCSRSLDGGLTWTPGTFPFRGYEPSEGPLPGLADPTGPPLCGGLHGHLGAGPDGTIYLPKVHCGAPMVAFSPDDGTSWSAVRVSEIEALDGPDPAVAVDAAGNVHYVFVDTLGVLQYVVSTDGGGTWSAAVSASPPGLVVTVPTIAAGADGKIAIAYPGSPDHVGTGYPDADEDAHKAAKWHGYLTISTDATSASPTFVTTRVNDLDHPLVRGECGTTRCPGFVDFMDVVIGIDGQPYAAFVDACDEECEAASVDAYENGVTIALLGKLSSGPSLL